MARVPNLTVDDVPADFAARFLELMTDFDEFSNQIPVYAHSPAVVSKIFELVMTFRESENLTRRQVEIAITAASAANKCAYCVVHHSPKLTEEGLSLETINSLLDPEPIGLSDAEITIRDYAVAVTERAWGIRDELYERMRLHFNDAQIVELTMRASFAGMFNKINQALGIEIEEGLKGSFLAKGLDQRLIDNLDTKS
ncbi:carboxymuconolactone decarboxylase family protein [Rhodospirillales bacterium]|nr:carboxymuconolactone decarboxylase family protein [Rhodospirillales bacterium]